MHRYNDSIRDIFVVYLYIAWNLYIFWITEKRCLTHVSITFTVDISTYKHQVFYVMKPACTPIKNNQGVCTGTII